MVGITFCSDFPFVHLYDSPGNGKSDPVSTGGEIARSISAIEAFKKLLVLSGRHIIRLVGYLDDPAFSGEFTF